MKAIAIIPARYGSTRFPGKPLATLMGKPVIQHVYENSLQAKEVSAVLVATDHEEILETVRSFGGEAVMTPPELPSGTDRIAFVAKEMDYDIIVNVQGDEPLVRGEMIDDVVRLLQDEQASMGTLVKKIDRPEDIFDPNVVKAVFDHQGFALYFSRAPIPYHRETFPRHQDTLSSGLEHELRHMPLFRHVGLYSYRKDVLLALTRLRRTALEMMENLEQLRALESGYRIKVKETSYQTIGVDIPEDLRKVESWLNSSS